MTYPFSVFKTQVDGHVFWVAKSMTLNGCVGQGDTPEEALDELEVNEKAWLETAKQVGIAIPELPVETMQVYSGKMTLRLSPHEHAIAAKIAKNEGISLNQYINDAVVARNHEMMTKNYVSDAIKDLIYLSRSSYRIAANNDNRLFTSMTLESNNNSYRMYMN